MLDDRLEKIERWIGYGLLDVFEELRLLLIAHSASRSEHE